MASSARGWLESVRVVPEASDASEMDSSLAVPARLEGLSWSASDDGKGGSELARAGVACWVEVEGGVAGASVLWRRRVDARVEWKRGTGGTRTVLKVLQGLAVDIASYVVVVGARAGTSAKGGEGDGHVKANHNFEEDTTVIPSREPPHRVISLGVAASRLSCGALLPRFKPEASTHCDKKSRKRGVTTRSTSSRGIPECGAADAKRKRQNSSESKDVHTPPGGLTPPAGTSKSARR